MTQTDSELNKKHSKLKLETGEDIETLRQAFRVMQEESNNRSKALASLSGELSQRKRGEENIYS